MRVNTKIIKAMNPCSDRLDNWLIHYKSFDGDVLEFLNLEKITSRDKIWVTLRLLRDDNDLFTIQVFSIDCSFAACAYANSAYAYVAAAAADVAAADADAAAAAAAAAYAAAYVAAAAADAYAYAAERERQVEVLIYLIKNRDKNET